MSFLWLQNMYWTGLGLLVGYIWWRLPDHLQIVGAKVQAWRETLPWNAREIARIEGAFIPGHYTPIEEPRLYLWERIRQYFSDLEQSTRPRPRTPEQVAEAAYRKALHANENPSSSRLLR